MKLQIVWRNPLPPGATKLLVRQIVADAYGALYEVRGAQDVKLFELLARGAARSLERCSMYPTTTGRPELTHNIC